MIKNALNSIVDKSLIIAGKYTVKRMLKNTEDAKAVNEKTLFEILEKNKNCEYGKKYDFANIHSIEEYQKKVPIIKYADIDSYVDRIYENNETNVLFSQKVLGFSKTSGSSGKAKYVPLSNNQVNTYVKSTVPRMMYLADQYCLKEKGKHLGSGYGLSFFAESPAEWVSPHGLPAGTIVDIPSRKIGFLFPLYINLPLGHQVTWIDGTIEYIVLRLGLENKDILFIFTVFSSLIIAYFDYLRNHWQMLCDDIEKGTVNDEVFISDSLKAEIKQKMKPNPKRAAELRAEFEKGFDETIIKRIWPKLEFINCIGTSPTYEPFTKEVRKYTKDIFIDFSIYGASEGLMAAAYESENPGQILLPDNGFYEFIEQTEDCDDDIKTKTIDQLEVGKEYEIVITTKAGLYRYRFGDVIKVLGFKNTCPIINFAYRKGQLITVVNDKTSLEQMVYALELFEKATNTKIDHWAVTVSKMGNGGHYIVLLESNNGIDYKQYEKEMEEALCIANTNYSTCKEAGIIEHVEIRNQKPGTYDEWVDYKVSQGATRGQVKPVTALDNDEKKEFFLSRVLE